MNYSLLLSLLPLSCTVVFIRELANIQFSNSLASTTYFSIAQIPSNIDMNVNYNSIREKSALSSKASLRNLSISSSTLLVLYYKYIEINNNLLNFDVWNSINSS